MSYAALWLMILFRITAFGLVYQVIHSRTPAGDLLDSSGWHGRGIDSGRYSVKTIESMGTHDRECVPCELRAESAGPTG